MHGGWVQSHRRGSRCKGRTSVSMPGGEESRIPADGSGRRWFRALVASAGRRLPRGARAVPLDGGESKMTLNKPYFFIPGGGRPGGAQPGSVCNGVL